jgi:nucleotidyltransferase substrate binding protein (TIGR01987 family)
MTLDLTSFQNALATLQEGLDAHQSKPEDKFIRDACIQRFEYCYEITHKMLRRYLEITEPSASEISDLEFPNLIRLGFERGLLASEWVEWKTFRNSRNITSHAYDKEKAEVVFQSLPTFLTEAKFLLAKIEERQRN